MARDEATIIGDIEKCNQHLKDLKAELNEVRVIKSKARRMAISNALEAGASFADVAGIYDITPERVRQIKRAYDLYLRRQTIRQSKPQLSSGQGG